ncbi:MAG: hypothetical protein KGM44_03210, partial [bacterium]|nr:hypothetical protein [bacterium]
MRNFILHRSLPLLAHRVTMTGLNTAGPKMDSEVELRISDLLEWDNWSVSSKDFLAAQNGVV